MTVITHDSGTGSTNEDYHFSFNHAAIIYTGLLATDLWKERANGFLLCDKTMLSASYQLEFADLNLKVQLLSFEF